MAMRFAKSKENSGQNLEMQNSVTFFRAYLIILALGIIQLLLFSDLTPPLENLPNDSAMRLVQVRDWLHGQGWYDKMQYRFGANGVEMHWSRLIDVPLGAAILFLDLFMERSTAEFIVQILWPVTMFSLFLYFTGRAALRLNGIIGAIIALVLATAIAITIRKFSVGSLDHHNAQLALLAGSVWAMAAFRDGHRPGIWLGIASALSLAIGLETIPMIAVVALGVSILWLSDATTHRFTKGFALGFGGGVVLNFILDRPDLSISEFRCDTLDGGLSLVAIIGAIGLGLLGALNAKLDGKMRILTFCGLGCAVGLAAILFSPACLNNPLSQLDPIVVKDWLESIQESMPFWVFVTNQKSNIVMIGVGITPVLAAVTIGIWMRNGLEHYIGVMLIILMAVAYGLMLYQIRNFAFVLIFTIYPFAWAITALYQRYKSTGSDLFGVLTIITLIVATPAPFGHVYQILKNLDADYVVKAEAEEDALEASMVCEDPQSYLQLNQLEPGLILTFSNYAPQILLQTDHSVLGSNFHRNNKGLKAALEWPKMPLDEGEALLRNLGVDYVVYCAAETHLVRQSRSGPNPTWAAILDGNSPDYLQIRTPKDNVFQVYEVRD